MTSKNSPLLEPLVRLADAWHAATRGSRRRVALACVAFAWVVALVIARQGTAWARAEAFALLGASAAVALGWTLLARRRLSEPAHIVNALAARVDRERALKALRALSLLDVDGQVRADGTSAELAALHVTRALGDVPSARIVERASRIASRVGAAALVGGLCVLGFALANAWRVLEGADVLLARRGAAPVTMRWLDDVELTARPPEYLRQEEIHEFMPGALVLPSGTLLTLRGVPMHPGRLLRLSDGTTDVPFVEDGAGAVVARWTLTQTVKLSVVVRFGDVVLSEPSGFAMTAVPDQAPVVKLEAAPRRVLLVDQAEDIPLKYVATDDHGLREVHLVLRSGVREERRVLARLDGPLRSEGGHLLRLSDPFLKRSHIPVEVTVEAKDNDPLTGPKWGASAAVVVVPPDVGEPEARRLDALRGLRDALVDVLAWRLRNDVPADGDRGIARKAFVINEKSQVDSVERLLVDVTIATYGGLRVPSRSRMMLVAQEQKARAAVNAEVRAPSASSHASAVKATERFLLVADAVVRGLGVRDARDSAKRLVDVAEDLASGAAQMQNEDTDTRSRGALRMDAATLVLSGGAPMMKRLGVLGRDLGEIVEADLPRVKRARDGQDLPHAELAARDLAARLKVPDPSFGSRGARRGGGESGGARGTPGDEDGEPPDDVEEAFNAAAQDLERLAQDHAGEIGKMEQALAGATNREEVDRMREEAKRHAEAIRQAARELPAVGAGSDSWTSKGAAARELAEQMAHALEDGRPDEAVQSGRSSVGAIDEGRKMLEKGRWEDPTGEDLKRLDSAKRKIQAEQKWAEGELELMRQHAAERARKELEQGGEEEGKLAERARDLADRGRDQGSLPQQAIESIDEAERAAHQAAEALRRGDADKGLERQREAQRDLEEADEGLRGDEDPKGSAAEGPDAKDPIDIPKATEHKGPEAFRGRVLRGLAQPGNGALKDAVRRYAEGLLR